jgi:hypothetical protein
MWIELGRIVLPYLLGLGSGVLLMLIKERRDKKGQLEGEQRQILTELQETLTAAKRVPRPRIIYALLNQEPPKPDTQYGDIFAKLRDLLARVTDRELLRRIRNVHIVSAADWLHDGEPLREALGLEEEEARALVLDDAHRVVSAVLRGERAASVAEPEDVEWVGRIYHQTGEIFADD